MPVEVMTGSRPDTAPLTGVTQISLGKTHSCAMNSATVWCWGSNGYGQLGTADAVDVPLDEGCNVAYCGVPASKVDADGRQYSYAIYNAPEPVQVGTQEDATIVVFDPAGSYVHSWKSPGQPALGSSILSIAAHAENSSTRVYAVSNNNLLQDNSDNNSPPQDRADCRHGRERHGNRLAPRIVHLLRAGPRPSTLGNACAVWGLATDRAGYLYTAVRRPSDPREAIDPGGWEIAKIDPTTKETLWRITDASGEFSGGGNNAIRDIATGVDAQGRTLLYVLDSTVDNGIQKFVHVYDSNGGFLRRMTIGQPGGRCAPLPNGQLPLPTGIGVADNGTVAVALEHVVSGPSGLEYDLSCVEFRSPAGAYLGSIGGDPDPIPEPGLVRDLAGLPDGGLVAVQALPGRVSKIDLDGVRDRSWGHRQFSSTALELTAVADVSSALAVNGLSTGARHTCALIKVDAGTTSRAWCWGSNSSGQLGVGVFTDVSSSYPRPPDPPPNVGLNAMAAGGDHTCLERRAASGGDLYCFGANGAGQLGAAVYPASVHLDDGDLVRAGANTTCITQSPGARCWGGDSDGQRGDGGGSCATNSAGFVVTASCPATDGAAQLTGIADLTAGAAHACAVADAGLSVYCWGRNDDHQVSQGSATSFDHAVRVIFPPLPGNEPAVDVILSGPFSLDQTQVELTDPLLVHFSSPVTGVDLTNVLVTGQPGPTTPLSGTQQCRDSLAAVVDCSAGPVATVWFTPADALTPGVEYSATVNPAGAAKVLVGGEALANVTVGTVHVALSDPVSLGLTVGPIGTLDWPRGLLTVPISNPIHAITASNLIATDHESGVEITGAYTCLDALAAVVDCQSGDVVTVEIEPDAALSVGALYDAELNPSGAAPALRGTRAVPNATAGPVGLADGPPVGIVLSAPGNAAVADPDGPFVIAFDQALSGIDDANLVVTPAGSTTPVAGTLVCQDGDTAQVLCASGSVARALFTPDTTLPSDSTYTATVDPPGTSPALVEGFRVPTATSNSLAVGSSAVKLTVTGPHHARRVPVAGPFVVAVSSPLTHVTKKNVVIRGANSPSRLRGSLICKDGAKHRVSCLDGPVSGIRIKPKRVLVPGAKFGAFLNPAGVTPAQRAGHPAPAAQSGPVRSLGTLDQSSPAVRYRWSVVRSPSAYGGEYVADDARNAKVTYSFTGRRVQWISVNGPDRGLAKVLIDGAPVDRVDGYAPRLRYGVKHTYGSLGRGPHRITIAVIGAKGVPASSGRLVAVDAFKTWSRSRAVLVPRPALGVRWGPHRSPAATHHVFVASQRRGATAIVRFAGTSITMLTFTGPREGTARAFIDGKPVRRVINHGKAGAKRLRFGHLTPGTHTLRIVVSGSGRMAIDGFNVRGRP